MTKFQHLLVPVGHADVFWTAPVSGRPSVATLCRPAKDATDYHWGHHACLNKNWDSNMGASLGDWLKSVLPEHVFATVVANCLTGRRGADQQFFWEVVRQFARIDACEWARTMYEQRYLRTLTEDDLEPVAILSNGRPQQLMLLSDYELMPPAGDCCAQQHQAQQRQLASFRREPEAGSDVRFAAEQRAFKMPARERAHVAHEISAKATARQIDKECKAELAKMLDAWKAQRRETSNRARQGAQAGREHGLSGAVTSSAPTLSR